jgi:hypothetical protein
LFGNCEVIKGHEEELEIKVLNVIIANEKWTYISLVEMES